MSSGAPAPVIGFFFPIEVTIPTSTTPPPVGGEGAILFTGNWQSGPGHIYKVQTDGTGLTQMTTAPANTIDVAAWSRDASRFAVVRQSQTGAGASVLVANADGSGLTTIWTGSGSAYPASQPSWTADGSQVVVAYETVSGSDEGHGAAFVNADGSGHSLAPITIPSIRSGVGGVVDTTFLDSGMYLSPDGSTLAFSIYYASGNDQFFPATCPPAGGTATVLTAPVPAPSLAGTPNAWAQSWFSDSTRLLCYGNGPAGARLFSMVTGTGVLIDIVTGLGGVEEFQPSLAFDDAQVANTDSINGLTIDPIAPGSTRTVLPFSPLTPAVPSWASSQTVVGSTIAATDTQHGIRRNDIPLLGNLIGSA